ncbi:MAG: hypothetical protein ACE5J9_09500 [Methanosarcinales archaeon]
MSFIGVASAQQLSVEKHVQNKDIKVGDDVNIYLQFTNPFNQPIPIQIKDKNLLGNNGLDIQCYEYTLPSNHTVALSYDPIQAYAAGEYTLDKATITYTNPNTGKEEEIKSNSLKITIKDSTTQMPQQQGITTIYNCGGVSMRSTQISSGSTSISINQNIGPQPQHPQPSKITNPNNIQQSNQDMENIKKEMQKKQQQYEEMKNELQKQIENNQNFQNLQKQLQKQGYTVQNKIINPTTNNTGEFNYQYKKGNETATISGKMQNGTITEMQKQSSEDIKKLQQYIEQNQTFQNLQKQLQNQGYNLSNKNINPIIQNTSTFQYQYNTTQGQTASIVGNVSINGTITDIQIKKPSEKGKSLPYWMLLLLLIPLIGLYYYKKYYNKNKQVIEEIKPDIPSVDPREEALKRIAHAEKLFYNQKRKEAYKEVSSAVRYYFKFVLKNEELTSEEIITLLRNSRNREYVDKVVECFRLCDLVKFAKYTPNEPDFTKVVNLGKDIIGK